MNTAISVSYPIPKLKKIQREQTTASGVLTFCDLVAHWIGQNKTAEPPKKRTLPLKCDRW